MSGYRCYDSENNIWLNCDSDQFRPNSEGKCMNAMSECYRCIQENTCSQRNGTNNGERIWKKN